MPRYKLTRNYNGHHAGSVIEVTDHEGIMTKLGYGVLVADDYQEPKVEVKPEPQNKMIAPKYKKKK